MPKRGVGHLNNLGGHAERNTKKTRFSQEQTRKDEKENVQVSYIPITENQDVLQTFYIHIIMGAIPAMC
jgi:hypothetical protein